MKKSPKKPHAQIMGYSLPLPPGSIPGNVYSFCQRRGLEFEVVMRRVQPSTGDGMTWTAFVEYGGLGGSRDREALSRFMKELRFSDAAQYEELILAGVDASSLRPERDAKVVVARRPAVVAPIVQCGTTDSAHAGAGAMSFDRSASL